VLRGSSTQSAHRRRYHGFQKRFSELRRANLPAWSPKGRFDHFYRLATNTRVAPSESGKILRVGDSLLLD